MAALLPNAAAEADPQGTAADVRAPKHMVAALDGSLSANSADVSFDGFGQANGALGSSSHRGANQSQDASVTIQNFIDTTKTATFRLLYEMTRGAAHPKYMAYLALLIEFMTLAVYAVPAHTGLHWATAGGMGGAIADGFDLISFCKFFLPDVLRVMSAALWASHVSADGSELPRRSALHTYARAMTARGSVLAL